MSPSPVADRSRLVILKVVPVAVVLPPALFCDGFEDLGSSAPALLGCLWEVADGESPVWSVPGNARWLVDTVGWSLGARPAVFAG